MLRYALLIPVLILAPAALQAQEETARPGGPEGVAPEELEARREATRHLLQVLQIDEQFEQSIDQALSFVDQMIEQDPDLSAEEKEQAKATAMAGMQASLDRLSWERLEPAFVEIYAEVFTVEEINGLSEFFESPTGRVFIEKQPQLMEASFRHIGVIVQEELPKIQEEVRAAIEEVESGNAE